MTAPLIDHLADTLRYIRDIANAKAARSLHSDVFTSEHVADLCRETLAAYDARQARYCVDSSEKRDDHTREPWHWNTEIERITDSTDCYTVADVAFNPDGRRIVACVNACAGISTVELEGAHFAPLYELVR